MPLAACVAPRAGLQWHISTRSVLFRFYTCLLQYNKKPETVPFRPEPLPISRLNHLTSCCDCVSRTVNTVTTYGGCRVKSNPTWNYCLKLDFFTKMTPVSWVKISFFSNFFIPRWKLSKISRNLSKLSRFTGTG